MPVRTPAPRELLRGVRATGSALAQAALRRPVPVRLGVVEEFGRDRVAGWVEVPPGAPPPRVALYAGGTEVAATVAGDPVERTAGGQARGFALALGDLWDWVKRTDRLSVRVDGVWLPIAGHGLWRAPEQDGPRGLGALRKVLGAGGSFAAADGRLQRPGATDPARQGQVLALYGRVRALLADELGTDAFVLRGTLLSVVRGEADPRADEELSAGYVSRHTDPGKAARELLETAFLLIEHGLDVEGRRSALHVRDPEDPSVRVVLAHLFFDEEGVLRSPAGAVGPGQVTRTDWRGVREAGLAGGTVLVPVCAEQLAAALYGPDARDGAARDRSAAVVEAQLPPAAREEVYWASFYARNDFGSGSTFQEQVQGTPDLPQTVIDIGCGQGRDAFAFATAGRTVMGIDRSHIGIRHAAAKAEQVGLADRLSFSACDVSDVPALSAVLDRVRERAQGGPVLFYARFFLHSIPEDVQEAMLGIVASRARPGDWFAAEFRTDKDEAAAKVYTKHYRRFQNGPAFGRRLADVHGWEVVREQEGTGLSPYRGEDPELYRVLARRP